MLHTTPAVVPRRLRVVIDKMGTFTAVGLMTAVQAVSGSMVAGRAVLPWHGLTYANGYPPLTLATNRRGVHTSGRERFHPPYIGAAYGSQWEQRL